MANCKPSQTNSSLWKQGLCWLLLLGPLFFLSYGQVNQFTATRNDVASMVFTWEHAIPFIPWTIVPYWSIDLLYGLSLFICTSKQELTRHGCRLLVASVVACIGFLFFPLRFSFIRPETQGIFGWLFHQLEQFDLPYNQAPSLHIILAWLLWLRFRQHLGREARFLCGGWFLLIAASVLTTWQHHFIDVISGFIVAVAISYAIPIEGQWRWKRPSPHALRLAAKYAAASALFSLFGLLIPYGSILLWPAVALLIVSLGYAGLGTSVFQKNDAGHLSLSARLLLWPYLIGARVSRKWFSRHIPAVSPILDGIFLGGFPGKFTLPNAVLDLTAEFHRKAPSAFRWSAHPLMDLTPPALQDIDAILHKLSQLRLTNDTVLVCCALGLSRSATVVAAWLLAKNHVSSVPQAIALIKHHRPQIVLTPAHIHVLEKYKETRCQTSA